MLRQLWCVVSTNMTCVVDVVAGSQHSDTQTVTRVGGDCDNEAWSAETLLGPALIMVTPAALLPQWESTQNIETETRDKWGTRQYSYTQLTRQYKDCLSLIIRSVLKMTQPTSDAEFRMMFMLNNMDINQEGQLSSEDRLFMGNTQRYQPQQNQVDFYYIR